VNNNNLKSGTMRIKVGEQNEIALHVSGTAASLVINGSVPTDRYGSQSERNLRLDIPTADQLIITPFVGWSGKDNVGTVDFENFAVSCK